MPIQQVTKVAGIEKHGGEQTKEQEFERIFKAAKANQKEKEQKTANEKKSGFSLISCCYGKHAKELGFVEQPIFDTIR